MSTCHGCASSFGFWKRNVGCPKCGFSYCQKCIRFKIDLTDEITGKENTMVVCQKCYLDTLTTVSPSSNQNVLENETTVQKEHVGKAMEVLETLDNPGKPPITLYRESNRVAAMKRGLSIEDQKIVDRLEELRGSRRRKSEQATGTEDVSARLAKLKDLPYDPASSTKSSISLTAKPETEDDLLARLCAQVQLEKNYESAVTDDIEQRLRKLKGDSSSKETNIGSADPNSPETGPATEDKTEEEQVAEIMQRYIAEATLSKSKKSKGSESDEENEVVVDSDAGDDDDEVDFDHCCRICEEKRATIMCKECDDDIFCSKCFQEFHDELGESHNPTRINTRPDE